MTEPAEELPDDTAAGFRSGFVSIVGRPNAGKSTLLNAILGQKIAITTSRPQTTRNRLLGIHTTEACQIVFMDTPGIHDPQDRLGQFMVETAVGSLAEVDVALMVVDPRLPGKDERRVLEHLAKAGLPVLLAINKMDTVPVEKLLPVAEAYRGESMIREIVPISALQKKNVDRLLEALVGLLPEGPQYYPEDMVTDQVERFMVGEIVREKAMEQTGDELPYSLAVEVEEFSERESGTIYIRAVIHVERESQKAIIIGRKGERLKKIGSLAREEISRFLDAPVFLDLWVKRQEKWRKDPASLRRFGYV